MHISLKGAEHQYLEQNVNNNDSSKKKFSLVKFYDHICSF